MNAAYRTLIAASDEDRRDLFLTTARRLGTAVQNVEKDFWVCWTLDVPFNGLATGAPRLLFKGGTSLSKSFGLIDRLSEDIDITVFRNDLGEPASVDELEGLSGKKRRARLDATKGACQAFFAGPLLSELTAVVNETMTAAGVSGDRYRVELDAADNDQQTLLFWYPSATTAADDYIRSAVKIEGAKSALDPHAASTVKPYAGADLPGGDLTVGGITAVDPTRTFWDKVVILHGLRRWFDHRNQLRHGGQRVSRHYYDVFRFAPVTDRPVRRSEPAACRGLRPPRPDVFQHARFRLARGRTGHMVSRADGPDARRAGARLQRDGGDGSWDRRRRSPQLLTPLRVWRIG